MPEATAVVGSTSQHLCGNVHATYWVMLQPVFYMYFEVSFLFFYSLLLEEVNRLRTEAIFHWCISILP